MKVIQVPEDDDIRLDDLDALVRSPGWTHARNRAGAMIGAELQKMATATPTIETLKERQGYIRGLREAMEIPETLRREIQGRR